LSSIKKSPTKLRRKLRRHSWTGANEILGGAKEISLIPFPRLQGIAGMDERLGDRSTKKLMSPCDVEALKKCLEENKGDYVKCQAQIEAFKTSCSLKKPNSSVKALTS
ncbi:hypothetical protein AKJ16_DCAP04801, partial [Drosera capensis]